METLLNCPVCSETAFTPFISCEDYTVSHKSFQIDECNRCGFKFTNPRPSEDEIGQYYQSEDYISHSNTSKGIVNSIYKIVREVTIRQKVNLLKTMLPGGNSILDYGCGTGEFLNAMSKSGWTAKGIEPGKEARTSAIKNYSLQVFEPSQLISFPEKSFDLITLWHVLEHVHRLNDTIVLFKKLLTDNGRIIIAVPNSNSADAKTYKEKWAAYDVPRHLYHFNDETMSMLFKNHKMKVQKMLPMPFDAFYVSMLSEKYKKSSLGFVKGLWNGLITNYISMSDVKRSSSLIFIIERE